MANITDKQIQVLINCIGAVETGGQVYGKRRYNDYTRAYTNSSAEDSITIGAFQEFKGYAKALLKDIQTEYPEVFKKYDNAGIADDIKKTSWHGYNPKKTSAKAKAIIKIIDSPEGHKVQDERIIKLLNQYISYAESLGVKNVDALFMCANFIHQGGNAACKRLVNKCKNNKWSLTLDNLYKATLSDKGNQVGVYKTRQKKMHNWIKQYISNAQETSKVSKTTTAEKTEATEATKKQIKVTNKDGANVRLNSNTSAKLCSTISKLKYGEIVEYVGTEKDSRGVTWYLIKKNNHKGYVSGKVVEVVK